MMFQGPKGYIAKICEVHLRPAVWKQYNKMVVLQFFLVNSILIYILFSLDVSDVHTVPFIPLSDQG